MTSEQGEPTGIVTLDTLRGFFFDEDIGTLAIAADCAQPFVSVTTNDSLGVALERFSRTRFAELPVVDDVDPNKILGLLSYGQLLQAYSQELVRRRVDSDDKPSRPVALKEPLQP